MTSIFINWGAIITICLTIPVAIMYLVALGKSIKRQRKQRKQTKTAVKMIAELDLEPMELELKDVSYKDPTAK